MDTSTRSVSKPVRRRRLRTVQEKRRIVEEVLREGESVAIVARRYEVNASQVFAWRRQYEQGLLELDKPALLPVTVVKTKKNKRLPSVAAASSPSEDDYVELELVSGERLRVRGSLATQLLAGVISRIGSR